MGDNRRMMHAVRSIAGTPTVVEVPEPAGDWPLLDVGSASICGSDLELLSWGLPVTIGHEVAGTVDGRPFCVEPTVGCGDCDQCRAGAPQRCRGTAAHGLLGVSFDGGLADRVRVPAECLVPLPDGLRVADACLVEPLAVSWHGLRKVSAAPGERVLVVGGGSVGLLAVAAARAMGLEVDLEARHPHQKSAGERLGAGSPHGEYDIVVEAVRSAVVQRPADVAEWLVKACKARKGVGGGRGPMTDAEREAIAAQTSAEAAKKLGLGGKQVTIDV